jgi:hypothetical protein
MNTFAYDLIFFLGILLGWMCVGACAFLIIFLFGHLLHKEYRVLGFRKSFSEFLPTYNDRIDWSVILTIVFAWPIALFFGFLSIVIVDDFGAMGP